MQNADSANTSVQHAKLTLSNAGHFSGCGSSSSSSSSMLRSSSIALLPVGYEPGNWDVICQRGKDCHEHVGNRRFRLVVDNHIDRYTQAKTRQDKSLVISKIVRTIKDSSSGRGGFVMKDPKSRRWYHVDGKVSRDKVGNALRDSIKTKTGESIVRLGSKRDRTAMVSERNSMCTMSSFTNTRDSSLMWMSSQMGEGGQIPERVGSLHVFGSSQLGLVTPLHTKPDYHQGLVLPAEGELKLSSSLFGDKYFFTQLCELDLLPSRKPLSGKQALERCLQSMEDDPLFVNNAPSSAAAAGVGTFEQVVSSSSARSTTSDRLEALSDLINSNILFQNVDLEPRPIGGSLR